MVYKCWPFQLLPLSSQLTGTAGEPIQLPAPGLAAFLRAWTLGLGDLGYSPGFLICSCVTLRKQFTLVSVFLSVKWRSGLPRWLRICLPSRTLGFKYWVRKILRGRKWQHTPVFLPGKSYGQRSLAGYSQVKVTQLCLTLCDTMDCIDHGILKPRILELIPIPSSRGSSQPRY